MGQTVVFTVPLDADGEVGIGREDPRPEPRRPLRDALVATGRDRHWWLALVLAFAVPAIAALVTRLVTGGAWAGTAYLVAGAIAIPASAAWASGTVPVGAWDERASAVVARGLAGAALALACLPGVTLAARSEPGDFFGPTLVILALSGAAGAWLGVAVGRRVLAVAVAMALALVPLAAYAAMLPTTRVTEGVTSYEFVASYSTRFGVAGPSFVCGTREVEMTRFHTEYVAWLASISPATWVVDAAGVSSQQLASAVDGSVAQAHAWMRSTAVGPDEFVGYCYQSTSLGVPTGVTQARYDRAGAFGANLATASAIVAGVLALVAVSTRRRQSSEVTVTVSEPTR